MPLARTFLFAASIALALTASNAAAGGINLSWDDCGSFGLAQRNFACNTNNGSVVLVVSAIPGVAMAALNGAEVVLTVTTPSSTLPAWWQRQSGGCHASGAPSATTDFTAGPFNCIDPWSGLAAAGSIFDYPVFGYGPDLGRIRTVSALPSGSEIAVDNVHELYIIKIALSLSKSVGTGACAGCTQSACIVLQSVKLDGPGGIPNQTLSNPILRQHAIWQDASQLVGCPGATPTRNRTWGGVKTLYR